MIQYNLALLTPPYQRCLAQQSALGAESLFYGYFHKSWVRLQHNYLCSQSLPCERHQAKALVATWALLFQTTARAQWDIRNRHLHDAVDAAQPHKEVLLRLTAQKLYDALDIVSSRDKDAIFQNLTLAQRLESPYAHLQAWVQFAKPVLSYVLKHGRRRPAGNTDIRDFFQPILPLPYPPGRPPGLPSHPLSPCSLPL